MAESSHKASRLSDGAVGPGGSDEAFGEQE